MKFFYIFLGLLMLIPLASAESTITNAYFPDSKIIINTTNNITNFSTPPDAPENYLQIYINNTMVQFNASSNTTISNITYRSNTWMFDANGGGFLNINATTTNSNKGFYVNSSLQSVLTPVQFNVTVNHTLNSNTQKLQISALSAIVTLTAKILGSNYLLSDNVANITSVGMSGGTGKDLFYDSQQYTINMIDIGNEFLEFVVLAIAVGIIFIALIMYLPIRW